MHAYPFSNCIFSLNPGILTKVIILTDGHEILTSIIKATQTAQQDLLTAISFVSSTAIKSALAEELQIYDNIESDAQQLASQRGWEINPNSQGFSDFARHIQMRLRKTDPSIAEFLILYHTRSMISGLQIFHRCKSYDDQINRLFQKLLFCQSSHIRQMQPFL